MPSEITTEDLISRIDQLQKHIDDRPDPQGSGGSYLTRFQAGVGTLCAIFGVLAVFFTLSINVSDRLARIEYQNQFSIEDRHALHSQIDAQRDGMNSMVTTINATLARLDSRLARIEVQLTSRR